MTEFIAKRFCSVDRVSKSLSVKSRKTLDGKKNNTKKLIKRISAGSNETDEEILYDNNNKLETTSVLVSRWPIKAAQFNFIERSQALERSEWQKLR
jgi:hypothetical protein